jgi:hypothetical protein
MSESDDEQNVFPPLYFTGNIPKTAIRVGEIYTDARMIERRGECAVVISTDANSNICFNSTKIPLGIGQFTILVKIIPYTTMYIEHDGYYTVKFFILEEKDNKNLMYFFNKSERLNFYVQNNYYIYGSGCLDNSFEPYECKYSQIESYTKSEKQVLKNSCSIRITAQTVGNIHSLISHQDMKNWCSDKINDMSMIYMSNPPFILISVENDKIEGFEEFINSFEGTYIFGKCTPDTERIITEYDEEEIIKIKETTNNKMKETIDYLISRDLISFDKIELVNKLPELSDVVDFINSV